MQRLKTTTSRRFRLSIFTPRTSAAISQSISTFGSIQSRNYISSSCHFSSSLYYICNNSSNKALQCNGRIAHRSFSSLPAHDLVPMPALSPTMEQGSIAKWLVNEGEAFIAGQAICEVETDKATVTFDATDDGYLAKILVGAGEVKVGDPLMITVTEKDSVAAFSAYKHTSAAPAQAVTAAAPVPVPAAAPVSVSASAPIATPVAASSAPSSSSDRVFASPLARKLARESGVDIALLKGHGSGPGGRIISADVMAAPTTLKQAQTAKTAASKAAPSTAGRPVVIGEGAAGVYQAFELSDVSRAVAARMTAAKQQVPHYYLSVELNLTKLLDLRNQLNANDNSNGSSISVLDMIVKATALAVKQVPDVNASWHDTFVRRYSQVDVNIVMGVGASVITPVLRNVGAMGLRQISHETAGFEDILFREDGEPVDSNIVAPGTISVHNLGMYGIKSAAPIVLPPQSCALALGAIVDTVIPSSSSSSSSVGKDGQGWTVAPVMTATLSCDHRVIDGAVGAQYLAALKTLVENPAAMIL